MNDKKKQDMVPNPLAPVSLSPPGCYRLAFFDTIRRSLELCTCAGSIELSDKILQRAFPSTSCIDGTRDEDEGQVQARMQHANLRQDHGEGIK